MLTTPFETGDMAELNGSSGHTVLSGMSSRLRIRIGLVLEKVCDIAEPVSGIQAEIVSGSVRRSCEKKRINRRDRMATLSGKHRAAFQHRGFLRRTSLGTARCPARTCGAHHHGGTTRPYVRPPVRLHVPVRPGVW